MITKHGHHIPDSGDEEADRLAKKDRCGGIHHCKECIADIEAYHSLGGHYAPDSESKDNKPPKSMHFEEQVASAPNTWMFRRHAVEFAAVQWTGDNLEEVQAFCGTRPTGDWDLDANQPHVIQLFNPIGTYLIPSEKNEGATGEVRDVEAGVWRPVNTGDWIVQQEEGFIPCTNDWIQINCIQLDDEMLALIAEQERPKSFEEELTRLINHFSIENGTGTPDHVLAKYLVRCLENLEIVVCQRAIWRGESIELPALQKLRDADKEKDFHDHQIAIGELDEKEVPLVVYTDGQRNEVGTAKVHVTPGEVYATGVITAAIPQFADPGAAYSVELDEPKDTQQGALDSLRGEAGSAFRRYQEKGLSSND